MLRLILAGLLVLSSFEIVLAKSLEQYVSERLIEGKWGNKPGEFGMTMWEGEGDYPKSFVVDSNENIYILDHINNRIQKFDNSGKYETSISIESYRRATDEEVEKSKKTWNKLGYSFPIFEIDDLYIDNDNNLYIPQNRHKIKEAGYKINILEFSNKKNKIKSGNEEIFKKLKSNRYPKEIVLNKSKTKIKIERGDIVDGNTQHIVITDVKKNSVRKISIKQKFGTSQEGLVSMINFIKVVESNLYIFISNPRQIQKFDLLSGELLGVINLPDYRFMKGRPFISDKGDIYHMEFITDEKIWWEYKGIRLIKWKRK